MLREIRSSIQAEQAAADRARAAVRRARVLRRADADPCAVKRSRTSPARAGPVLHEVCAVGEVQLRAVAAHHVGLRARDGADVHDEIRLDRLVARIPQEQTRGDAARRAAARGYADPRGRTRARRAGLRPCGRVHVANMRCQQQRRPGGAQSCDERVRLWSSTRMPASGRRRFTRVPPRRAFAAAAAASASRSGNGPARTLLAAGEIDERHSDCCRRSRAAACPPRRSRCRPGAVRRRARHRAAVWVCWTCRFRAQSSTPCSMRKRVGRRRSARRRGRAHGSVGERSEHAPGRAARPQACCRAAAAA